MPLGAEHGKRLRQPLPERSTFAARVELPTEAEKESAFGWACLRCLAARLERVKGIEPSS